MVTVEGVVQHGLQLGRRLGFPTANLPVPEGIDAADGVYESRAEVDGTIYRAMSNLGRNPSVGGDERKLETHIFGFEGSLYGRMLRVELIRRIRGERRFASLEELQAQIERDRALILAQGDTKGEPGGEPGRMLVRIALIGLGVIGEKHMKGLSRAAAVELVAVCDVDSRKAVKASGKPFYTAYPKMIEAHRPDWVVVAIPPASHAEVVHEVLSMGCNVLCEKPLALNVETCDGILADAASRGADCSVTFHWQYGNEALYLYRHAGELLKGGIRSIRTWVCDDYCDAQGNILPDRRSLCGTWFDGGINVLSFYDPLFDTDRFVMKEKSSQMDDAGYERWSRRVFDYDGAEVEIEVDWRRHSSRKRTVIRFDDGGTIAIDHSRQRIAARETIVFDGETDDRLSTHYGNLYAALAEGRFASAGTILRLHRLLIDNR